MAKKTLILKTAELLKIAAGMLGLVYVSGCVTVTDDEGRTYTVADPLTNVVRKHISPKWGGTRKPKKNPWEGKANRVVIRGLGTTYFTTCNYLDDRNNNRWIDPDDIMNPKTEFSTNEQVTVWIRWQRKNKGNLKYVCWNDENKVIHSYDISPTKKAVGGVYPAGTFDPGVITAAVIDKSKNSRVVSLRFRVVKR